ncbi:hypothetical protein O181_034625 [Austropuccinia psidii MF-1]|uniref:Uncharacterized protein n=1 Tax=Austropuccinia psidii MF-1 TaxID=1389203 RepID=A0A9Q3D3C2_9BASI|nr:hypothetical protein [Austropuccinia psidii MF-1]
MLTFQLHPHPSHPPLTILTLTSCLQCLPHTSIILNAPAAPSQCDSNASAPGLPSPLLTPLHPRRLQFLHSPGALKISLRRRHLISALTPALSSPLLTILMLLYEINRVWWLVGIHNECNHRNMLSGLLCQQVLRGNW